jgi:hypothetical protein
MGLALVTGSDMQNPESRRIFIGGAFVVVVASTVYLATRYGNTRQRNLVAREFESEAANVRRLRSAICIGYMAGSILLPAILRLIVLVHR